MTPDTPRRVLDAVAARPGSGITDVARALAVDHSTAAYHLHRLERRGHLTSVHAGRIKAHYVAGCGVCPLLRAAKPLLDGADAFPLVVQVLQRAGGVGVRAVDVARATDTAVGPVRWALLQAVRAGIAETAGFGRFRFVRGAATCAARHADGAPCGAWSRCVPGARWRQRELT